MAQARVSPRMEYDGRGGGDSRHAQLHAIGNSSGDWLTRCLGGSCSLPRAARSCCFAIETGTSWSTGSFVGRLLLRSSAVHGIQFTHDQRVAPIHRFQEISASRGRGSSVT